LRKYFKERKYVPLNFGTTVYKIDGYESKSDKELNNNNVEQM